MAGYPFKEEVLREEFRKKSALITYILGFVIFGLIAGGVWLLNNIVNFFISSYRLVPLTLYNLNNLLSTTTSKAIVCAVAGVLAVLILIFGVKKISGGRLVLTKNAVFQTEGNKNCKEARLDKIDAIFVKGSKIKVFAGGKKVISFGPVKDPYVTRNVLAKLIVAKCGAESDFDDDDSGFNKAVPMYRDGEDVFDGDVIQ